MDHGLIRNGSKSRQSFPPCQLSPCKADNWEEDCRYEPIFGDFCIHDLQRESYPKYLYNIYNGVVVLLSFYDVWTITVLTPQDALLHFYSRNIVYLI